MSWIIFFGTFLLVINLLNFILLENIFTCLWFIKGIFYGYRILAIQSFGVFGHHFKDIVPLFSGFCSFKCKVYNNSHHWFPVYLVHWFSLTTSRFSLYFCFSVIWLSRVLLWFSLYVQDLFFFSFCFFIYFY